jgi:hypothetical protein
MIFNHKIKSDIAALRQEVGELTRELESLELDFKSRMVELKTLTLAKQKFTFGGAYPPEPIALRDLVDEIIKYLGLDVDIKKEQPKSILLTKVKASQKK